MKVLVYGETYCSFSTRAASAAGVPLTPIEKMPAVLYHEVREKRNYHKIPVCVVNGAYVGGCDELLVMLGNKISCGGRSRSERTKKMKCKKKPKKSARPSKQ
jgi:glutaredoxin